MKIVCLGDSLTEGDYGVYKKRCIANVHDENYPYFLSKKLSAEVRNLGKCGCTPTSYLKFYNEGRFDFSDAELYIIMLGTNGGLDAFSETQCNEDYKKIISLCRENSKDTPIVLCTPPHVTEDPEMSNYGFANRVKDAVLFVKKIAAEQNLKLIDVASCDKFTAETEHIMQPNDGNHGCSLWRRRKYCEKAFKAKRRLFIAAKDTQTSKSLHNKSRYK